MSCEHCTTTLLILGIFFSFFSSKLLCFIFVILGVCKIFDHLSKSFFKPCLVGFCLFLSDFYLFIYFLWKPIELKYDIELISVYDLWCSFFWLVFRISIFPLFWWFLKVFWLILKWKLGTTCIWGFVKIIFVGNAPWSLFFLPSLVSS